MNKNNAKDFLPFVQALAEGKTIQYKNLSGEWTDAQSVSFSGTPSRYRIKPSPIERWGVVSKSGNFLTTYEDEGTAAGVADHYGGRYFLMREVI